MTSLISHGDCRATEGPVTANLEVSLRELAWKTRALPDYILRERLKLVYGQTRMFWSRPYLFSDRSGPDCSGGANWPSTNTRSASANDLWKLSTGAR